MPFAGQLAAQPARPDPAPALAWPPPPADPQPADREHHERDGGYADNQLAGVAGGQALMNLAYQSECPLPAWHGHRLAVERVEQCALAASAGCVGGSIADHQWIRSVLTPEQRRDLVIRMLRPITRHQLGRLEPRDILRQLGRGVGVEPFQNIHLKRHQSARQPHDRQHRASGNACQPVELEPQIGFAQATGPAHYVRLSGRVHCSAGSNRSRFVWVVCIRTADVETTRGRSPSTRRG